MSISRERNMAAARDKALGAFFGAAIGDAMGGPVEAAHHLHIRRTVGEISGLLPYEEHYSPLRRDREYMRSYEPGAITDDTFIRADLVRFLLATKPPRTPRLLADWLLANADFSVWWPPVAENLRRVERGEVAPEEAGLDFAQGGGNGWWTPIGILHAGNPAGAEAVVRNLSRIWKCGTEQDLLSGTQAALAAGLAEGATYRDVIDGLLMPCGRLARSLVGRGLSIGMRARTVEELAEAVYAEMLMPSSNDPVHQWEPSSDPDAPLPEPVAPLPETDQKYLGLFFAEQIPIAAAAFAFGKGDPRVAIPAAVMVGRDCDSTATTVGSWCGALTGESGLPAEWVDTVCRANAKDIDLRGLGESLADLAA